jgi:hypothetical protein
VHVAAEPLEPSADHVLPIGWDGGHSPSAAIGQLIGGQVQVFAGLNDMKVGVLELIEDQVIPWLVQWAPWTRRTTTGGTVVHVIDPSMATPGQTTIREGAERAIRETLRGRIVKGPVAWSPRREAVLRVLAPRHAQGRPPCSPSRPKAKGRVPPLTSDETPPVASQDGVRAPASGGVLASRLWPVCQKAPIHTG